MPLEELKTFREIAAYIFERQRQAVGYGTLRRAQALGQQQNASQHVVDRIGPRGGLGHHESDPAGCTVSILLSSVERLRTRQHLQHHPRLFTPERAVVRVSLAGDRDPPREIALRPMQLLGD